VQAAADGLRTNPLKIPRWRVMKQKQGKSVDKIPLKNELPRIRVQKTGSSAEKSESR